MLILRCSSSSSASLRKEAMVAGFSSPSIWLRAWACRRMRVSEGRMLKRIEPLDHRAVLGVAVDLEESFVVGPDGMRTELGQPADCYRSITEDHALVLWLVRRIGSSLFVILG